VTPTSNGQGQPATPVLEYPLDYVFKVMGLTASDFPEHARALVARAAGGPEARLVQVRSSSEKKYQSVSISVLLASEAERRAVYEALRADARVVYYL